MKKLKEYTGLWILGGMLYYGIEVIFRGFSHWSMFVLGGVCMTFCGQQGMWTKWEDPLWMQVVRCSIFVTAGEFITGIIVNKWLKLNVWDYSDQPFHLLGQICLAFIILFSGLCVIAIYLSAYFLATPSLTPSQTITYNFFDLAILTTSIKSSPEPSISIFFIYNLLIIKSRKML